MAGSLEDGGWGGPLVSPGNRASCLIPRRPTRGAAADLGVRPTRTLHAREAPPFPATGCSCADIHIAPADPSASSATSAPSGFDFCFFSQRLGVSAVTLRPCSDNPRSAPCA